MYLRGGVHDRAILVVVLLHNARQDHREHVGFARTAFEIATRLAAGSARLY